MEFWKNSYDELKKLEEKQDYIPVFNTAFTCFLISTCSLPEACKIFLYICEPMKGLEHTSNPIEEKLVFVGKEISSKSEVFTNIEIIHSESNIMDVYISKLYAEYSVLLRGKYD